VLADRGGRMRVRIAADYERLEFLRVLRSYDHERIGDPGGLIAPARAPEPATRAPQATAEAGNG
jgi:rod shape-determining protein MreC